MSEIDGDKTNCGGLHHEEKNTVKGKGGIRTHARFYPPIPVAGGLLKPLEYLSEKERVGFEPTHRFIDLTVFKTVPFSQTWVSLRIYFPSKARRMSSMVRLKSS